MSKALITGITGQDGAYLAKLLLEEGWDVYGGRRRGSTDTGWRLYELNIEDQIKFVPFELHEMSNIQETIKDIKPDVVYNLAAHSFVGLSFVQPHYTTEINALGPLRILEAIRTTKPDCRFYQASSSEMFGDVTETPQDENTAFRPLSPYGSAKELAHWNTVNYRSAFGMYCVSGILFNHESPLRGIEFVTRKISAHLAHMVHDPKVPALRLGSINVKRDWGFSKDYVRGMYLMMTQEKADDYVLATGEMHSVKDFVGFVCEAAGFTIEWNSDDTAAFDLAGGRQIVQVDKSLLRQNEVNILCGDASKAREELGWRPYVKCRDLAHAMYACDFDRIARGQMLQ